MVSLSEVRASNAAIASALPGLVAVFVGGTNGIGEATLKQLAKHARQPRVYIVGRSQEAADRIITECATLNPEGKFTFIKADTSLIRNVDNVCRQIQSQEKAINLLFLTTGTLQTATTSEEGLRVALALAHYARARFIENLLPNIQAATQLRRVVSVFAATKEGTLDPNDFQGWNVKTKNPIAARGRAASLVTLYLEAIAKTAPDVTFIHDFPGFVKSGITRDMTGFMGFVFRNLNWIMAPLVGIPPDQSGETHVYFATSARFPVALSGNQPGNGIKLSDAVGIAIGTDGKTGSGVYSIDEHGESQGRQVEELLANYRKDGVVDKVWEHTQGEFRRIVGEQKS